MGIKNTKIGDTILSEGSAEPVNLAIGYGAGRQIDEKESKMGIKVEEATLQFIVDDKGHRWFVKGKPDDYMLRGRADELYDFLVEQGYITPDALEKALEAVDNLVSEWETDHSYGLASFFSDSIKNAMRTLYEEATCSSTKQE